MNFLLLLISSLTALWPLKIIAEDIKPLLPLATGQKVRAVIPTPSPTPTLLPARSIDGAAAARLFTLSAPPEVLSLLSGRIAFSATVYGTEGIFILDLDGKTISSLVQGPGNNRYPAISSDGEYVGFVSDRDGNEEIYITRWDGTDTTRITNTKESEVDPTWIPRTTALTFARIKSTGEQFTTDLVASAISERPLGDQPPPTPTTTPPAFTSREAIITTLEGKNVTPAWTPNKDMITYSTNRFWPGWDICGWQIQAKGERCFLGGNDTFGRARWSPDGLELAFSYGGGREMNLGLSLLGKQSFKQLTYEAGNEYDPEWAPQGDFLAFVANKNSSKYDLYVMTTRDGVTHPLITSPFSIRYLSWSAKKTTDLEIERVERLASIPTPTATPQPTEPAPIPTVTP